MRILSIICMLFSASCAIETEQHSGAMNFDTQLKPADAKTMELTRGKTACFKVYPAAYSALKKKNQGVTQEALLAALPERIALDSYPPSRDAEKRLGLAMLDIAHQVYSYENLDSRAFPAYSAEVCQRKLLDKEVPESFDAVYPELLKCNSLDDPKKKINCGMAVAGSKT